MAKIILTDVHRTYDGEYELDPGALTHRDFHTIKRLSGVRRQEIADALVADDADLILAFAVVCLERSGLQVDEDLLWNAPGGRIQLALDDEEAAESSPPLQAPPAQQSADGESSNDSTTTSGDDTKQSSVSQENGQSPTGSPLSETLSSVREFVPRISQG